MLDGLSAGTSGSRRPALRTSVVVVTMTLAGLAMLALIASQFGVFDGFRSAATTTAAVATGADRLVPAPALACETGSPKTLPGTSATTDEPDSTPLAAAQRWVGAVPKHENLVDAREFDGTSAGTAAAAASPGAAASSGAASSGAASSGAASAKAASSRPADPATSPRVVGWFDHDGTLKAEVTVVPDGKGGWVSRDGAYCD